MLVGEPRQPPPTIRHWAQERLSSLSPLPRSLGQVEQLSPTALAYIGDGVYELLIRTTYLLPPQRIATYHRQVVSQVRAEQQAAHLDHLIPYLTAQEQEILRRGRNAATRPPQRLDPGIYQRASSLETLIGYLYLTDPPRLSELFYYLQLP
ncbi:ribonuclease III domain-containing protein [Spirulina subsalsa CS-330]|uniref:Mini-ribonuclease 3 n=1 Tax=Spirulina TaxID=1154 RepID=UPI00232D7F3B|nr:MULTISPECIES: ribonuclease III domain-containing protein [Spirulina]MDB9494145.1 ribonuclease III domain-containing protein [Spirulina subsalsa CS-330]